MQIVFLLCNIRKAFDYSCSLGASHGLERMQVALAEAVVSESDEFAIILPELVIIIFFKLLLSRT